MSKTPLAVVILAAGKGTRMKSDKPKVMHEVMGLPMVNWVIGTAEQLGAEKIITVIGPDMPDLAQAAGSHDIIVQRDRTGTGSALKTAMPLLEGFKGNVLVLLGDTPLISCETLKGLIEAADDISVLGVQLENPSGYGRLLMDSNGNLTAIREEKDASEEEKKVNIVNTGAFCLNAANLEGWLAQLSNDNAQGEYYITDLPEIAAKEKVKTAVHVTHNTDEVQGCNTRIDLAKLEATAQQNRREEFLLQGVRIQDPSTVYFHHDTQIAADVMIEPSVFFGAGVKIEQGVHIKAFCHIEGAHVGAGTTLGPFARLRPGANIGEQTRIGNFVEIKKSKIGNRSKVSHFGYIGDATVGEDVNFGCGAITVNYDGQNKFETIIEDNVMIGSNANLVAPVTVKAGAFIAAGSTITTDVPADALALERTEMEIREGWASQRRKDKA